MSKPMQRVGLCACLIVLESGALAQTEVATARQRFEAGTRAFNLGEFDNAAREYREAYKLKPDPAILYNVAQSYRLAKNTEQALFFYRSYLRNSTDPSHRQEVERRIHALEEQLRQEQAPPNDIRHAPSVETQETKLAPAPTTPSPLARPSEAPNDVTRTPVPASSIEATRGARADLVATPPRRPVYKRWWLWTVTGVVVVGVGVGLGVGLGYRSSAPSTPLGNHVVF
jgi:hypothetical protein